MNFPSDKKLSIAIAALSVIVLVLVVLNILLSKNKATTNTVQTGIEQTTSPQITINPSQPLLKIIDINALPTLTPDKGEGIDIGSKAVVDSTSEIKILEPYLPYTKDYNFSNNQISVLINDLSLQDNPWSLNVQVFGIDYNVGPNDQDYNLMRDSFRIAASNIFTWASSKGANPKKIIFTWGNREFIEKQSEAWLK